MPTEEVSITLDMFCTFWFFSLSVTGIMTMVPYLLLILCGVTLFTAVLGGPVVLMVGKHTLDAGAEAPRIA